MDTNDRCIVVLLLYTVHVILFVSCFGAFVIAYSFIYLFIYLSQFTSLLRSFSSYETSHSVGVVKTGENPEKKKPWHILAEHTCLTCAQCVDSRPQQTQR